MILFGFDLPSIPMLLDEGSCLFESFDVFVGIESLDYFAEVIFIDVHEVVVEFGRQHSDMKIFLDCHFVIAVVEGI